MSLLVKLLLFGDFCLMELNLIQTWAFISVNEIGAIVNLFNHCLDYKGFSMCAQISFVLLSEYLLLLLTKIFALLPHLCTVFKSVLGAFTPIVCFNAHSHLARQV